MPGGKASVDSQLVSSIDWAPTVLSLAGIRPPKVMQGRAFLGPHADPRPRRYAFAARDRLDSHHDRVRSVHDGRYQYLRNEYPDRPYYMDLAYRRQQPSMREILRLRDAGRLAPHHQRWFLPKGRAEELYDVVADPWQLLDLSTDPAYAAVVRRMRAAFEAWQREVPDLGAIPEKELVRQMWAGGDQPPVTADPVIVRRHRRIRLVCPTPGATLAYRFTQPGQPDTGRWLVYTAPVACPPGYRVEAVAHRIGYRPSRQVAGE
jgi:hypothetical protein